VEAKEQYKRLMTDFQEMKVYETFGESAPQAALQIAIVLQTGTINTTQIFTIFTSLLSLTLGASEIMLMMKTKDNEFREASWKQTWILVFPVMFFVVMPRILSASLIMAYSKELVYVFLIIYVIISMIVNSDHLRRDPGHVTLGILTNLFAPCIVIQEGSSYFETSGVTSSILHSLGLLSLFFMIIGGIINVCPDTASNRYAPILHCFNVKSSKQTLQKCQFDQVAMENCTKTFTNLLINETVQCSDDLFSCENPSSEQIGIAVRNRLEGLELEFKFGTDWMRF
jgi:hypothetical protein